MKNLGMSRIALISVVLLTLMSPLIAAGDHDDHNDAGPIQTGWALITPSTVPATGLVVFETFGARSSAGDSSTTQAGVLPPDLTTNALLFVDASGRLSKNVGVAIVNPNASSVTVTLTLRKSDGSILAASSPITVLAHQQISKFVTELFTGTSIPSDITGSLTITSSGGPVSVIGLRFRGKNFSTLPATNLSTAGPVPTFTVGGDTVGGPGAILLPHFAAGGGWASEIVIVNPNGSSVTIRVDLFKADGNPLIAALNGQSASSFKNLTIPAGGVLVLAPRNQNGDDDF